MKIPSKILPLTEKQDRCSTFMFRDDHTFLVGHNLDESYEVPGVIAINKRNVQKTSISFFEILTAQKPPSPTCNWTSRYGSVTFNALGREFPDGGINEAGLYIQEMTLAETVFPQDNTRPKMFMMQWMQYQLDNFDAVKLVLASSTQIVLDGWEWHFFVSDIDGNCASIEFLEGKPSIHTGSSMPVPVLCNTHYPQEIEKLEQYEGFGGDKPVDLHDKTIPRFVHATHMIQNPPDPVSIDYGFEILKTLERGSTRWSYIIDVYNQSVCFHTSLAKERKYFDIPAFDLSCDTPARMLDIHSNLKDNVAGHFVDFSLQLNRQFVEALADALSPSAEIIGVIEAHRNTVQNVIKTVSEYPDSTTCVPQKTEA